MQISVVISCLGAALAVYLLRKLFVRLQLSRAKHPSLRGHAKMSRRAARLLPYFGYAEDRYFCSDEAPRDIENKRRHGMQALCQRIAQTSPKTLQFAASLEDGISDVRFTSLYRVPFPYRAGLPKELRFGTIAERSHGVEICDLDGQCRQDLSGSYGVNIFGYDFYKECLAEAHEKAGELGPVLGPYHPLIRENVDALKRISGLDEVSFHMSGTEAVMQAVRLARYHTGRSHLVRLCGSYHGWWDGVQPGVGNQRRTQDVYTLADLSAQTLKVLSTRKDIACVLINPLQAFHPNSDAPGDTTLIASQRSTQFDKARYSAWLQQIREICTRRGIALIFDEVFVGFRFGLRGAQGYYGVQADLVTYGKSLGGGLPVGVVCGRHALMKRYKEGRPAHVSFARGTFNSHPYVMASMAAFLRRVQTPEVATLYAQAEACWNARVLRINQQLQDSALPLRIENLHSILTVIYTQPSRYNWMLQFYLRDAGLELSWIGTGRFIMSLNYSDAEFDRMSEKFIAAARQMQADGWWWQAPHLTNKWIKRQMLKDMISAWRHKQKHSALPDKAAVETFR